MNTGLLAPGFWLEVSAAEGTSTPPRETPVRVGGPQRGGFGFAGIKPREWLLGCYHPHEYWAFGCWLLTGGFGSRGHVHPAARNTGVGPGPRQLHPIFDGKATAKPFATDSRQRF